MTSVALVGGPRDETVAQLELQADKLSHVGRAAGVTALLAAGLFVFSIVFGVGNVLHGDTDSSTALAFAAQHGQAIVQLGFMDGMLNILFALLLVQLVAIAGADLVLAPMAYVCAAGATGVQWTHAGMLYALSDLATRGGADAGVLALFTLGSTMDEVDGLLIAAAMACAGWLLLRSGRTPALVPWLTLFVAGVGAAITILGGLGGPDVGPIAVISAWIWLLGIGITLLIKPIRHGQSSRRIQE